MAQATLSVRMNSDDKRRFEKFCDETGMNVSVAINMFVKAVLRENRLPFDVKTEYQFYIDENMASLRKSIEQIEKTGGTLHEVPEV